MGYKFNPFTGNFDDVGSGGGGNPFDQSLNTTDSPSFLGLAVGTGTHLSLGNSYGQFTSAPAENAGFTINRGNDQAFASFDLLTGADPATGWSLQMQYDDGGLSFVNRALGSNSLYLDQSGSVQIHGLAIDPLGNVTAPNLGTAASHAVTDFASPGLAAALAIALG
jgi:hypothetical protein